MMLPGRASSIKINEGNSYYRHLGLTLRDEHVTNDYLYRWEKAGKVWWETMNSGQIPAACTFIQFADVTVDKAEELFGNDGATIVRKAWTDVGVVRKS